MRPDIDSGIGIKTAIDKGVGSSGLLEANILINKLRHLINHITLMRFSEQNKMVGKANKELDKYFLNGGKYLETKGF